ncbi:MAG: hypothetical protein QOI62_1780 [Solirubrobacteraceae bacterium]|jgi:hypothetical protein|nr:hypothetical protein [Solirubrobacteraceae bacterium]MEA2358520.1 hypothetical protein [Solirubrobacteraceae bacterium]MEA2392203.1 hypothetical protein [Solirubrobacteraceae bacterium]
MPIDRGRTARGALAGALAAGAWSVQAPLDRRAFGVPYSDPALLGKAVTRGPAWPVVGIALHLLNGAAFGAAYANVAPRMPVAPWARGPLAALAEHVSTWPLTIAVDRVHPARDELPTLWGDARTFAQATWRHLLFGVILGELERRFNTPEPEADDPLREHVSSNGHGNLEHAVGAPGA